jgi:anti-anti-sigma factor
MTRAAEPQTQRYRCLDITWTDDVCVARFSDSSLDEVWIDQMGEELRRLIERDGCRKLVLSLADLDCLYSVLLGKLMTLRRVMQAHGGRLKLCDASPLVREVFRVCKVDGFFEFAPDLDAALREW